MTSPTVQGGLCQTRDSRVLDGRGGKTLLLRRRRHVGELSTGVRFHTHPLPAAAPKTVVLLRPLKCHCNKKGLSSAPRLYSNRGFPPGRVQSKGSREGRFCGAPVAILSHLVLHVTWLFTSLEGQLPSPSLLHWVTHDPQISHPPEPLLSSTQLAGSGAKPSYPLACHCGAVVRTGGSSRFAQCYVESAHGPPFAVGRRLDSVKPAAAYSSHSQRWAGRAASRAAEAVTAGPYLSFPARLLWEEMVVCRMVPASHSCECWN